MIMHIILYLKVVSMAPTLYLLWKFNPFSLCRHHGGDGWRGGNVPAYLQPPDVTKEFTKVGLCVGDRRHKVYILGS